MNSIIEVTVTETKQTKWETRTTNWVKLETPNRVIHSHETRSEWFPVKNYQFATDFSRELEVGEKVLLKYVYAGYYSPLTKVDIFGNPYGNCKIAKADEIASVFGIKEGDSRIARLV